MMEQFIVDKQNKYRTFRWSTRLLLVDTRNQTIYLSNHSDGSVINHHQMVCVDRIRAPPTGEGGEGGGAADRYRVGIDDGDTAALGAIAFSGWVATLLPQALIGPLRQNRETVESLEMSRGRGASLVGRIAESCKCIYTWKTWVFRSTTKQQHERLMACLLRTFGDLLHRGGVKCIESPHPIPQYSLF